jgi:prostaglandin-endoperoxide synthase 2
MAPRSSVWRRRGPKYTVSFWVASHLDPLWDVLNRPGLVRSLVNEGIINQFVTTMEPRPDRLSTLADYTSWRSLTDRTFSGRHLPPRPDGDPPPPWDKVRPLFCRPGNAARPSRKSTLLFPFFAQWFVDGFLRTDPGNPLRNRSTHDIDLSQLYGQDPGHTEALRTLHGGELKWQPGIDGEYPPYYFKEDDGNGEPTVKSEFEGIKMIYPEGDSKSLDPGTDSTKSTELSAERRRHLFALGLPRGNIHYGTALMSTIFLREHNRVARLITKKTGWDPNTPSGDERIFETTRNALIVMLLKVVIQDYINHISPFKFKFRAEPGVGADRDWFRTNWMSIEFDMLYRWHTLIPDRIKVAGAEREFESLLWDTDVLTVNGVSKLVDEASRQPCTEIGLMNTPKFLLDVEERTLAMGRLARVASYNDYRQACGYPRLSRFADVSSDPEIQRRLKETYGTVDEIEFYVGLLAEDVDPGGVLGDLMGTMVGVDAFSQAMTNPLLDPRIFSADTFSEAGLAEIKRTNSLCDIVRRNVPPAPAPKPKVSFDRG